MPGNSGGGAGGLPAPAWGVVIGSVFDSDPSASNLTFFFIPPFQHRGGRKMKPTVGLTHFFYLMKDCEKKADAGNVYEGLLLFKNTQFLVALKNLFFLHAKNAFFLHF